MAHPAVFLVNSLELKSPSLGDPELDEIFEQQGSHTPKMHSPLNSNSDIPNASNKKRTNSHRKYSTKSPNNIQHSMFEKIRRNLQFFNNPWATTTTTTTAHRTFDDLSRAEKQKMMDDNVLTPEQILQFLHEKSITTTTTVFDTSDYDALKTDVEAEAKYFESFQITGEINAVEKKVTANVIESELGTGGGTLDNAERTTLDKEHHTESFTTDFFWTAFITLILTLFVGRCIQRSPRLQSLIFGWQDDVEAREALKKEVKAALKSKSEIEAEELKNLMAPPKINVREMYKYFDWMARPAHRDWTRKLQDDILRKHETAQDLGTTDLVNQGKNGMKDPKMISFWIKCLKDEHTPRQVHLALARSYEKVCVDEPLLKAQQRHGAVLWRFVHPMTMALKPHGEMFPVLDDCDTILEEMFNRGSH